MSKSEDFEMRNPLYGLQKPVVQDAIRRARRERAEVMSALVKKIFQRRGDETAKAGEPELDWKSLTSSGI